MRVLFVTPECAPLTKTGGLGDVAAALPAARASPLPWRPEIMHCNDWPTALAPVYLHFEPARSGAVMTVHNLAYQGIFDASLLERLELPRATFAIEGIEFYGRLSFLKGGLVYSDAITTVSPTYAREILTEEFGCGLDGVLRERRSVLRGILNGIDGELWNPMTDSHLAERYSWNSLDKKAANKAAVQRRLNLAEEPVTPLLGVVSRFAHQKGIDLLAAAADDLVQLGAELCVLGRGEREHEVAIAAAAARHPGRVALALGFNEELAHLIEAGADMFLMPSRYEPCGLNQMYSQRYGTPPVARATGGLVDTIVDGETGFLFERAESAALVAAVQRAVGIYRDTRRWREMQRRGMVRDFSWSAPARQYADLY